jgi:hypothetical protein
MKKSCLTRRRRALKRLAVLLALILVLDLLGLYHTLPVQAMRQCAASAALGDVEIVRTMSDRRLPRSRYYLCANEDAVALLAAHFYVLLGWQREFAPFVPRAGDEPVKACYQNFARDGLDSSVFYVFGRVDDPPVSSITLRTYWYGTARTSTSLPRSQRAPISNTTAIPTLPGRYELSQGRPAEDYGNEKLTASGKIFLTPCLADGTALAEYPIEYGTWTMLD